MFGPYLLTGLPAQKESWCFFCLSLLPSSLMHLFFSGGHHAGLSCSAGHVCSWRWRPCNANPPPRLRKVPCLPVQNENNKELSVAAASRVQCTHQNMSKSHSLLLLPTHLSMRDSPSLSCFSPSDPLFNPRKANCNITALLSPKITKMDKYTSV